MISLIAAYLAGVLSGTLLAVVFIHIIRSGKRKRKRRRDAHNIGARGLKANNVVCFPGSMRGTNFDRRR